MADAKPLIRSASADHLLPQGEKDNARNNFRVFTILLLAYTLAIIPRESMNPKDWSRLLILSLLWGGTYMLAAIALKGWPAGAGNGVSPLVLVWLRVSIAALVLLAVLTAMGVALPRGRQAWIAFFGMGMLNNVLPFSLIFWGQSQLPASVAAGLASILNATTPLFTVIVLHVFTTDERATPLKVAGVLLGLAGVAVMIGLDALSGLGAGVWGQAACLMGAVIYAFSSLYGRRFKALGVTPLQTALGQLAASTVMMSLVTAVISQPWTQPMPGAVPLIAVVAIAVFSTALAYILFFQLLSSAGATNLMLVTFLIPVSAILLGVLVLGEALKPQHLAGMAFIGLGLAAIDGRLWRRFRPG
jgi:drug/metabolite transporter (DMT)-like permease